MQVGCGLKEEEVEGMSLTWRCWRGHDLLKGCRQCWSLIIIFTVGLHAMTLRIIRMEASYVNKGNL